MGINFKNTQGLSFLEDTKHEDIFPVEDTFSEVAADYFDVDVMDLLDWVYNYREDLLTEVEYIELGTTVYCMDNRTKEVFAVKIIDAIYSVAADEVRYVVEGGFWFNEDDIGEVVFLSIEDLEDYFSDED